jgi:hypothetical protein
MPLLLPEELSLEDRAIYRRRIRGLFVGYAVLLIIAGIYAACRAPNAPTQAQALEEPASATAVNRARHDG